MCAETRALLSRLNADDVTTRLATHGSPVIAGLKISNLFTVRMEQLRELCRTFKGTPISILILWTDFQFASVFLYRGAELEKYLEREDVRDVLRALGYQSFDMASFLKVLKGKYCEYREGREEFPHELGIALGYPPEDVLGFMENDGRNYSYCGYWKVYGSVEPAVKAFDAFDQAKDRAIKLLSQNRSLLELMPA